MKDYAIQIKIKNGFLLAKMRERGIETVAELARQMNSTSPGFYRLANLSEPAVTKRGHWKQVVLRLAKFFNCMPEELVPPQHVEECLKVREAEVQVDAREMGAFIESIRQAGPEEIVATHEMNKLLAAAMSKLTPRQERVLRMRYGFDGSPATLEEVGNEFGLTKESARRIEAQAVRRLKHSSMSRDLVGFV